MKKINRSAVLSAAGIIGLFLLAGCAGTGTPAPSAEGSRYGSQGIRGTLTTEGKPLKDAYVYAYRSYSTNLLGPADFASNPSGADGSYAVDLVKGSYYLVARKRATGDNTGPLTVGDLYSINPSNPVTVKDGAFRTIDLDLVKMRDPMFFQSMARETTGTAVKGTIVDEKGNPVPWVFAMAYSSSDMKRVPEHTSVMTGSDGNFVIFLPGAGRYWLAARKNIRGKPVVGEAYGLYLGSDDHSVTVAEGQVLEGIKIQLETYHKGIQD